MKTDVKHPVFGIGRIEADLGDTVIVRFSHGLEQCDPGDLAEFLSAERALSEGIGSPIGKVILRMLSHSISSCNDTWGVFSPSRIDLLPHQLWVCRKVLEKWPFRWLVADDVGLGKTIEAGLILWPLLARKVITRLLVITPASLVEQWQFRMRTMFDIRMAVYHPANDTPKQAFWETHSMVAASVHTLRDDYKDRHERLLNAEPWDLVIVDECHHLNFDAQAGKTLNYQLLEKLVSEDRAQSVLFFSGTPHRGKHHNFFALLELLRPDLFDHQLPASNQLKSLHEVMIRNNKQTVTDLSGNRLFFDPKVEARTYSYSPQEAEFYQRLTEFILSGKAYASSLTQKEGQVVILVLIVMQKLASSSVAAIRSALKNRLQTLKNESEKLSAKRNLPNSSDDEGDEDFKNKRDEEEVSKLMVILMEHEQQAIEELLKVAESVKRETKIEEILEYTRDLPENTSVLFFTEYKATQAMLLGALIEEYGEEAVTFINGDEFLPAVRMPGGVEREVRIPRENAADLFNSGNKRFLVSTEAAGEGIDLQETCHRLVHVDLPWNPMRLHQRHGRLNRYGQKKPVEITLFRNPDTLEGQIWELLSEKINAINESLAASMDEPEDLFPLVLGMTSNRTFDDLYFNAQNGEGLKEWFNAKTATMGGADIIDTVRGLVGNSQRFDFKSVSKLIPNLDLPQLQPFFEAMLRLHRKQIRRGDYGISFKTPEVWSKAPGVPGLHQNIFFHRRPIDKKQCKVTGVGSPVLNQALLEAREFSTPVGVCGSELLDSDIFLFQVEDRLTGSTTHIQRVVCGVRVDGDQSLAFQTDAEVIKLLNDLLEGLPASQLLEEEVAIEFPNCGKFSFDEYKDFVMKNLPKLQLPFRKPEVILVGALVGSQRINPESIA
jgi:ERCC4-related helicase